MPGAEEPIVSLTSAREQIADATEVRSTVLCASLRALELRGLRARYQAILDPAVEPTISALTPGQWVPIDLALAHYRACDGLGLDRTALEDIGDDVGKRIQKSVLSVAIRLSRNAGASPWSVFPHVPRLNELSWRGGAFEIVKLGPKDARMDWIGQPCASIPYCRTSFCGFVRGLLELFCARCFVRPILERCDARTISLRIAWA